MMKSEFESLAGRNVTDEQYKAIETLYMSSNLEKAEFVKSIRTMLKSIPQPEKKKDIKRMVVRDRSGYRKTPNGCYYHIEYVELVDIDIKTGKYIIKPLEDKDFEQLAKDGHDLNLNTYECDGLWFNNTIVAVALFGGNRGNGSLCGLSCWSVSIPATSVNTDLVASLSCKPPVAAA